MTVHYHGTPITPKSLLTELRGNCFCVSYANPQDLARCHMLGQLVMLDNGAYSVWRGTCRNKGEWPASFYKWAEPWLEYSTTWAVIPDIIDGSEAENDRLLRDWPYGQKGSPVFHLHESLDRLKALAYYYDVICFGSSGQYRNIGSVDWYERVSDCFDFLFPDGVVTKKIHMLRGMAMSQTHFPFYSVDSADIARNFKDPESALLRMRHLNSYQCPPRWKRRVGVFNSFGRLTTPTDEC